MNRPLRSPADLARAGLAARADLPALEAVATRYAVSVTPDMADLIDQPIRGTPSPVSSSRAPRNW